MITIAMTMAMTRIFLSIALSLILVPFNAFTNASPTNSKRDNIIGGPLPLPFPVSDFTKTVASVQNTYCGAEYNNPGLKIDDQTLLYSSGDASTAPRVNVYHSDSLGLIVAYMGTNLTSQPSTSRTAELYLVSPDPALGLPADATVVKGWQDSWSLSWNDVKSNLRKARQTYLDLKLVVTGHSQGSANAELGALSILKEFGSDFISKIITFGPPRVGNLAYADAFDSHFKGRHTAVTNGNDWVQALPPAIGYRRVSGMTWIYPPNSTSWGFYPDQEDLNGVDTHAPELIDASTHQIFWGDHQGIYMHSSMGINSPCPAQVGGF